MCAVLEKLDMIVEILQRLTPPTAPQSLLSSSPAPPTAPLPLMSSSPPPNERPGRPVAVVKPYRQIRRFRLLNTTNEILLDLKPEHECTFFYHTCYLHQSIHGIIYVHMC
ncbi:unnamed protein product [Rotaria sp. Silwood2]|nr:unnamed protein product [Rotaria sp. Silwood2]CAF4508744.1 unnamed protein product [Rotaria sp. Silwood2]